MNKTQLVLSIALLSTILICTFGCQKKHPYKNEPSIDQLKDACFEVGGSEFQWGSVNDTPHRICVFKK